MDFILNNIENQFAGLIHIDKNGKIVQANEKISKHFEIELEGKNFSEIDELLDSELKNILIQSKQQTEITRNPVNLDVDNIPVFALPVYTKEGFEGLILFFNLNKTEKQTTPFFDNANIELEMINDILEQINSTLNLENVLDMIFNRLESIFDFDGICIQLLTRNNTIKTMKIYHEGAMEEDLKEMENLEYDFETANDSIKSVLTKGEYFIDSDTLYLPLIARDEIIGLLSVSHFERGLNLTEKEIASVKRYAGYISTALNNSYLYTEIEKINQQLKEKDEIITHDLLLARKIQQKILIKDIFGIDKADFFVEYIPFLEVGGDYYDISKLDETGNIVRVFLADATGHGIPAGLITMLLKSEYEKIKYYNHEPHELLMNYNEEFTNNYYDLGVFCTCLLMDINLSKGTIKYSSAGHPPQILISSGKVNLLTTKGSMIGLSPHSKYEIQSIDIKTGDKILLFTDGIFEEFDQNDEMYGEERLYNKIHELAKRNLKEITDKCVADVKKFMTHSVFEDDITFIGVTVK